MMSNAQLETATIRQFCECQDVGQNTSTSGPPRLTDYLPRVNDQSLDEVGGASLGSPRDTGTTAETLESTYGISPLTPQQRARSPLLRRVNYLPRRLIRIPLTS